MAAAIQAAQLMQTSPFVFGRQDLHNLTTQFRMNNVPLTSHIDEVMTQLMLVENVYTFVFTVPIINTINNFHLYEVKALPVFKEGDGYSIPIRNKYVAVNTATMEYFTASETEFDYCTRYPMCTVSEPFRKITSESPCEVVSLKFNTNMCTVVADSKAKASFISNRNVTYFSVPEAMEIHLICTESGKEFNQHTKINDYGSFNIPDGCEVKINNEISFRPGFVASVHTMTGANMFEILQFPEDIHEYPQKPDLEITTRPPLSFQTIESLSEGFNLIFDHETAIGEVIRICAYIAVVIVIFLIFYCCCRPCRLWFNGCCFIQKPTVYWKKIKGYKVPEFQNLKRLNKNPSDIKNSSMDIKMRTTNAFEVLSQRVRKITEDFHLKKTTEPTSNKVEDLDLDEIRPMPTTPPTFRTLHLLSTPSLYNPQPFPK